MTAGRTISTPTPRSELTLLAEEQFGDWIKAVVDVSRGVMAVGGDLHADDEAVLLAQGSAQRDLWGINLHPAEEGRDWIEFDSLINIRPRNGNRSRSVDDQPTRARGCCTTGAGPRHRTLRGPRTPAGSDPTTSSHARAL